MAAHSPAQRRAGGRDIASKKSLGSCLDFGVSIDWVQFQAFVTRIDLFGGFEPEGPSLNTNMVGGRAPITSSQFKISSHLIRMAITVDGTATVLFDMTGTIAQMVQRSCGHRNIISDWEAVKHALYSTNILLLPGESEKEDAYLHCLRCSMLTTITPKKLDVFGVSFTDVKRTLGCLWKPRLFPTRRYPLISCKDNIFKHVNYSAL